MLFTYMVFFSFAYLSLSAGTGALILFGAVQLTMFIVALREREYFPFISWIGFVLAFLGLIPSEHSSGERVSKGSITKTGNGHVRRALVAAAHAYRFQARKSRAILNSW